MMSMMMICMWADAGENDSIVWTENGNCNFTETGATIEAYKENCTTDELVYIAINCA
jgi:hypothetical protein